ncbi:MAG TPA: ATP-binding protein [Rhizomicrobium sp.]|jgi:two-component system nitrogen regulation sensor histidine kinase GlnL
MASLPAFAEAKLQIRAGTSHDIAAALPTPLIVVGPGDEIRFANPAAEEFFGAAFGVLRRRKPPDLADPGGALVRIAAEAKARGAPVVEHDVPVSAARDRAGMVDIVAAPYAEGVIVALHERTFTRHPGRQFPEGTLRSLNGMAAVLAHEIKNPLAGIRGAAQLLEESVDENGRVLARLIRDESDRVRTLIDRMEMFGDARPVSHAPVNIHEILDRVRKLAQSGFVRHAALREEYDPSLPSVPGDRDRLIQLFVNLVRNAADAVPEAGGEIVLSTAFRPGMRLRVASAQSSRGLPLEVCVRDNGHGIAADLLPHIFDPFVTTRPHGTGLGLALAAKIVAEHGGAIECDSAPGRTAFRVLLPVCGEEA